MDESQKAKSTDHKVNQSATDPIAFSKTPSSIDDSDKLEQKTGFSYTEVQDNIV